MVVEQRRNYSNGKLLLSGEYVVLDGALSLALPTRFGQSLEVEPIDDLQLNWKSLDEKDLVWFENTFTFNEVASGFSTHRNDESKRLIQILNAAKQLNSNFLNAENGFNITTHLDFPRNWGLGSSSTLINNIAQWAKIDAYALLKKTFGGSGYDIACAQHNYPITYQFFKKGVSEFTNYDKRRDIKKADFNPSFKDCIYFVHLNKKQDSRDGIAQYIAHKKNSMPEISEISDITSKMIACQRLEDFEILISRHEGIISKVIQLKPVKELLFKDFKGAIKSLGAWGGDFVLVATKENPTVYFKNKGFETILSFNEMVL